MGKMGKAKEWAEKPAYLSSAAAKHALGIHRGPLPPKESVDGGDLEHVETTDTITLETIKRTPTQNLRRHWARFWCCYVFWSIIFLAIFLPIFFLIIIPAISQNVLDRSSLVLTHASILEPRPDSMVLTMGSALKLPISLPVQIDPMTLDLFNREQPGDNTTWGKVYLPATTIKGNTTLGVTNQLTPLDAEQWYNYVWKVVHLHHPPLSAKGKTTAYLGDLVNHVKMDKDIPQTTLNNFTGFEITDSQLLLPPREDGVNLIANATLPNPSVLTLEIGNTTMDLFSGDLLLGNASLPNLMLKPGNHSTPVEGILDLQKLIKNIKTVIKDQASSLKNGNLELKTIGRSVYFEGVKVPYYSKVMQSLTLIANVPVGGLLANTVQGVLGGDNNPFANLSLSEPESSGSSSSSGGSKGSGLLGALTSGDSGSSGDSEDSKGSGLLGALTSKESGDSGDSDGSGLLGALTSRDSKDSDLLDALTGLKKIARDLKLDKRGVDYLVKKLAELED